MNNREFLAEVIRDLDSFHYMSMGNGSYRTSEFMAVSDGVEVDCDTWGWYYVETDDGQSIGSRLDSIVEQVVWELVLFSGLPDINALSDAGCTAGLDYDGKVLTFSLYHDELRLNFSVTTSPGRLVECGLVHAFRKMLSDAAMDYGFGVEATSTFSVASEVVKTDSVFTRGGQIYYMTESEEKICHQLVLWELKRRGCSLEDTTGVLTISNGIVRFSYAEHDNNTFDELIDRL